MSTAGMNIANEPGSMPWVNLRRIGITKTVDGKGFAEEWTNDAYDVSVIRTRCPANGLFPRERMCRIGVCRCDGGSVMDWRDLQCIKNDVCGILWEAVELYPSEDRLVDPSNYRILWAFERIPLGIFRGRLVLDSNDPDCIAPQRPQLPTDVVRDAKAKHITGEVTR